MTDTYVGLEEKPRIKYVQVPNIVDDFQLDPFSFRLYVHLRRVAGEDGACWQSTATLAAACKMSMGEVSKCKQILFDHGLIYIMKRKGKNGYYDHITIADIWAENLEHDSGTVEHSLRERIRSSHERLRSSHEGLPSPDETKKIPLRKSHEEVAINSPESIPPSPPASPPPQPAPDTQAKASALWKSALVEIEMSITPATYGQWFKPTRALGLDGDKLIVQVHSVYAQQWLDERMRKMIERTVSGIASRPMTVVFHLAAGSP